MTKSKSGYDELVSASLVIGLNVLRDPETSSGDGKVVISPSESSDFIYQNDKLFEKVSSLLPGPYDSFGALFRGVSPRNDITKA